MPRVGSPNPVGSMSELATSDVEAEMGVPRLPRRRRKKVSGTAESQSQDPQPVGPQVPKVPNFAAEAANPPPRASAEAAAEDGAPPKKKKRRQLAAPIAEPAVSAAGPVQEAPKTAEEGDSARGPTNIDQRFEDLKEVF